MNPEYATAWMRSRGLCETREAPSASVRNVRCGPLPVPTGTLGRMAFGTRVCVFCGSSSGRDPAYGAAAESVGKLLASRRIQLVYGGGRVGLMGVLADAALGAGGEVVGVIPEALDRKEVAHANLTELHVVRSMHERKALMARIADAFLAIPGGIGTLEEFCEALTWAQLGIHRKPLALLNIAGYYDALLGFLDRAVADGFLRPEHRRLVIEAKEPTRILDEFDRHVPPRVEKWLDAGEM